MRFRLRKPRPKLRLGIQSTMGELPSSSADKGVASNYRVCLPANHNSLLLGIILQAIRKPVDLRICNGTVIRTLLTAFF